MTTVWSPLARSLGIEPAEGRIFVWGAATYFLVHSASVALANVSDTLFLKRIGVNFLPLAFLVSSLLLVATTSVVARLATRRAPLPLLARTLLVLAAVLIPVWFLVLAEIRVVYAALVLISKQVEVIAVLVFWVALGGLLHARQAKRLYAPIVAGGTLGEIVGSFASGAIGQHFGMAALLPAAAIALLLAAGLATRATAVAPPRLTRPPRPTAAAAAPNALRLFGPIWRESRLFRILAVSALLCGMLGPMLYFQFSYVADQATRGADGELRLLGLYAGFRGWLNVAVLVLQLVGTARLFRRIGVPLAATFSPLVYLFGFFGVSLRLGLEAALGAMAGASLQDHAVYDPAQKVLVTLFPERLRPAATTLVEGPIQRAGGALGNVLVLAIIGLGAPTWVAPVGLPIAALWTAAALTLWRIYPSLLLEVASARLFRRHDGSAALELVDAGTVRLLEAALTGPDGDRARAACALVLEGPSDAGIGALARATRRAAPPRRGLLLETLHRLLDRHADARPSAPAAARELEALLSDAGGGDPLAGAYLIEAYARVGPELRAGSRAAQLLEGLRGDPSPAVSLAATARLHAAGILAQPDGGLDALLATALAGDDRASRHIALDELRALLLSPASDPVRRDEGAPPDERWAARVALVAERLADPRDRARAAEVLADAAVRYGPCLAALDDRPLDHLDDPEPRVRIAALRFIGGTRAEAPLRQVVDHLAADDAAEAAAAAAALRAVGPAATHALIAALLRGRRATRDAALPLLRELAVAPAALRELIDREVERIRRLVLQRYGLAAGPAPDLVLQRVRERIDEGAHGMLLLLAALRDDDRLATLARLLARSRHGRPRAVLLEALETLLPSAERERLLPLLDDDVAGAAAASNQALGRALPTFAEARRDTMAEGDPLTVALLSALAGGGDLQHSARRDAQPLEPEMLKRIERVLQLRSVDLFAGLTTRQLTDLAAVMREEHFAAGDAIVREGEFGDCMYVIVSGTVTVSRAGARILNAGTGEFFGEMSVFDGETRSATVAAASPVHVLSLERHELFQLMDEQPSLAIAMCQTLARRVRDAMGRDSDA